MSGSANARASAANGPAYRRFGRWLAGIDDGAILRAAFFALLAGTIGVLFVDYRELTAEQVADLPMPAQPILPPARHDANPAPMPDITTDPDLLQQPLSIALENDGQLMVTGTIDPGSAERFADEIAARGEYVRTIVLDSPGGSVRDALAIGDLVHEKGLDTAVRAGALCASSCPIIFAAGTARRASAQSAIGVHQIYAAALPGAAAQGAAAMGLAMSDAQSLTGQIITNLSRSGIDPALWLKALATPPEQLYYFSGEEMVRLKLVTELVEN